MVTRKKTTKRTNKQMQLNLRPGFCVINHMTPSAKGRTVCYSENEAIEYAKQLINEDHNRGKQTILYVVEIKKVVMTEDRPIIVKNYDNIMDDNYDPYRF